MALGYGIPSKLICWHYSTKIPTARFELTDNFMEGFDQRFILRFLVADRVIEEQAFGRETRAREIFERKVQAHYDE